jgi:hypothetical protein
MRQDCDLPFRHIIAWIGSLPATKGNFKKLLSKGSIAVVVGGIAEVCVKENFCCLGCLMILARVGS